jgi:hypothetical protein
LKQSRTYLSPSKLPWLSVPNHETITFPRLILTSRNMLAQSKANLRLIRTTFQLALPTAAILQPLIVPQEPYFLPYHQIHSTRAQQQMTKPTNAWRESKLWKKDAFPYNG